LERKRRKEINGLDHRADLKKRRGKAPHFLGKEEREEKKHRVFVG